nr:MAG TPA: hypothetical protein [Crassvirales sp.]
MCAYLHTFGTDYYQVNNFNYEKNSIKSNSRSSR